MTAKRITPAKLAAFLADAAPGLKDHWLELSEAILGAEHADAGWYRVSFPKNPSDYPNHVPFASLKDSDGEASQMFLAVDASVASCPVAAWDE